jgi:hypothetical protein
MHITPNGCVVILYKRKSRLEATPTDDKSNFDKDALFGLLVVGAASSRDVYAPVNNKLGAC